MRNVSSHSLALEQWHAKLRCFSLRQWETNPPHPLSLCMQSHTQTQTHTTHPAPISHWRVIHDQCETRDEWWELLPQSNREMMTKDHQAWRREEVVMKREPQMNERQGNVPQSHGEERCDRFGFSHELTLLNKMAERERGGGQKVGYAQIPSSSSC